MTALAGALGCWLAGALGGFALRRSTVAVALAGGGVIAGSRAAIGAAARALTRPHEPVRATTWSALLNIVLAVLLLLGPLFLPGKRA